MNEFFKILLSLSFSGTLLLLPMLMLKPLYKDKFSKCWQYYIWLVIALRFLLPITPEFTLTGYIFESAKNITSGSVSNSDIANVEENENFTSPKSQSGGQNYAVSSNTDRNTTDFYTCLFFAWSSIVLALIVRKITIYQNFIRYVKAGNSEVSDIEILNLLASCEEKLNIRKPINLYCNPLIGSPIMAGFLRPAIIIPDRQITKEEMAYIFRHELTHYKRQDMLYKWFIQIVICIHWFNPFVYLLGKVINRDCELSCDEAVIYSLDDSAKKLYGDTLLSFVKANNMYKNSLTYVTLTEGAEQLKERLGAIMKFKKKSKTIAVITTFFTVVICFCFMAAGAYAVPAKQNTKQNTEKEHIYTQNGYYYDSFIFEMGWNLEDKASQKYSTHKEIVLKDKSKITVYFNDSVKKYVNDRAATKALGKLIYSLNHANPRVIPTKIRKPCILHITPVASGNLAVSAKEYYQKKDLIKFSAVFPALDNAVQKSYYKKMYDNNKVAFFSSVIENMDNNLILQYAKKAEHDNKMAFFSILLDEMQPESINSYAKKFYAKDNIAGFSILVGYLPKKEIKKWLVKAEKDKKKTFSTIIADELSD